MEITALLFFEPDAEGLLIKTLAGCSIANDWTKSGNKQNFDICEFVHGDLPSGLDCMGGLTPLQQCELWCMAITMH